MGADRIEVVHVEEAVAYRLPPVRGRRVSAPALAALEEACGSVAAEGTDPALLAVLLAWTVRPRRSLEALRRRALTDGLVGDAVHDRLSEWTRAEVDGR
jgi:hypothetical protein